MEIKKIFESLRKKPKENPISLQQLRDNWSAETNEPKTQEWRNNLSLVDRKLVERWDNAYQKGVEKMVSDIRSTEAEKGLSCYRIMHDPEKSWKPYRSEPMYDGQPEMGTYTSTYGLSSPKAGDYLVTDQAGISVRTSSDRDFKDVRFSAMPSLDEMISSGMVVRVPQQLMDQDLAQQDQIQNITDMISERQQHMYGVKVYIADLRSEASSDQRSENMRNAFSEIEKTQDEIAELKGRLSNLEEEYQRFEQMHFLQGSENEIRMQQLDDNWSNETNDPETQEWRDDLSAEELAQVEKWDDDFEQKLAKMAADILALEEKKSISSGKAMAYDLTAISRMAEDAAEELHETLPIGRIDYLGSSGRVRESIEYTDEEKFKNDIKKENYYGVPMSISLYRDVDGQTIPHEYMFELDPPPAGFSIEDNPHIVKHTDIEQATKKQCSLEELKLKADQYCATHSQTEAKLLTASHVKIR